MKVVTPAWLVDSAAKGVLLNWRDYIFRPGQRLEHGQGRKSTQVSLMQATQRSRETQPTTPTALSRTMGDTERRRQGTDTATPALSAESEPMENLSGPSIPPVSPRLHPPTPTTPFAPSNDIYITAPIAPEQAALVPTYAAHKSNPAAQRAMQDPGWRAAHTSAAPGYIAGFYANSRLHHLSTWKAELRALVIEAQERAEREVLPGLSESQPSGNNVSTDSATKSGEEEGVSVQGMGSLLRSPKKLWKGKGKAKPANGPAERVIMHCDFDSFFVAAGLIDRPELRGQPVVVCHSQGTQGGASSTSEIASASYEARKFGIKAGMRFASSH
jgi:DNA repair protein REV1